MAFLISLGFYAILAGIVSLLIPRRFLGIRARRIGALAVIGGIVLMGIGGNIVASQGVKAITRSLFSSHVAASSLTSVEAKPAVDRIRSTSP